MFTSIVFRRPKKITFQKTLLERDTLNVTVLEILSIILDVKRKYDYDHVEEEVEDEKVKTWRGRQRWLLLAGLSL